MQRTRLLLILGLATYLIVLIAKFPASVALGWFAPARLEYTTARGSIWRGDIPAVRMDGISLGQLRWEAHPLSLLAARFDATASVRRSQSQFLDAHISIRTGGVTRLTGVRGILPLSTLSGVFPAAGYRGELTIQLDELQLIDGWPNDARGTIGFGNLTLTSPVLQPLGSYQLVFLGAGDSDLKGTFTSIHGPLNADGSVTLKADRSYEVSGLADAGPDSSEELKNMIRFIGPPQDDGRHEFTFAGSL